MSETWHYLENQFAVVTIRRRGLADSIYKDHEQKLTQAAASNPALVPLLAVIQTAAVPWTDKYAKWKNARAALRGTSQALQNLLDLLTIKPVGGGRSRIEEWDSKIRAHWSPGDPIYAELLPQGREPFTSGGREAILDEVVRLADRLEARGAALLAAAGTATGDAAALLTEQGQDLQALRAQVAAFGGRLVEARHAQTQTRGLVERLSEQLEPARLGLCDALYRNTASLIALLVPNQKEVAAFFDLSLIMSPPAGKDEDEPAEESSGNAPAE